VRLLVLVLFFCAGTLWAVDAKQLSAPDKKVLSSTVAKLDTLIRSIRTDNRAVTLTFEQLYAPLSPQQRAMLDSIRKLGPADISVKTPLMDCGDEPNDLVKLPSRKVKIAGKDHWLTTQYLPKDAYTDLNSMLDAMQKDIGKTLYVESGYRSPAYQLYLFVCGVKRRDYDIKETARWIALPGYSEHGCPIMQAMDFMTEDGLNCNSTPSKFAALPEYAWLKANGARFNFQLSYPSDSKTGIGFEPWHWRHVRKTLK